ncbi:uncharacterized protein LOC143032555 [Oratosquilla oratoria]|uniref:uncharacterized protein LOC143032555 n=1 Tax=Oratosquilla oratoria TaxID=337810 RepID=UPI003F77399C
MKFYPQPADSPDAIQAWVHEDLLEPKYSAHNHDAKVTMDPLDSFLRDLPPPTSTFAELKPLEPLDYLTQSPDTSASSRQDSSTSSSTSSSSPGSQYKGAIANNNTFLGYNGTPEPVSTTTSPLPSTNRQEPTDYIITQDFDDIASLIGSAIADNNINNSINNIMIPETLEHLNVPEFQDIEAWIESMSSTGSIVKVEHSDPPVNSTMSPVSSVLTPPLTQVPQASTTSSIGYPPTPTSSPMLQSLLAAGSVSNNNYLNGLVAESQHYGKVDPSMPILQARLTQGLKDSVNAGLLKTDPMFSRSHYYTKDSLPHSTDPTSFAVTTTDDLLISKFDTRSYLDKSVHMASPESSDLSTTKLGMDFPGMKNKNRNRMNKGTKLPITTEGTKDKPIHRCTVCNRGFLNKSNIKVHLRTHTGEKPFKCETCNKAFRQKAHLLKHYQIHKRVARD